MDALGCDRGKEGGSEFRRAGMHPGAHLIHPQAYDSEDILILRSE